MTLFLGECLRAADCDDTSCNGAPGWVSFDMTGSGDELRPGYYKHYALEISGLSGWGFCLPSGLSDGTLDWDSDHCKYTGVANFPAGGQVFLELFIQLDSTGVFPNSAQVVRFDGRAYITDGTNETTDLCAEITLSGGIPHRVGIAAVPFNDNSCVYLNDNDRAFPIELRTWPYEFEVVVPSLSCAGGCNPGGSYILPPCCPGFLEPCLTEKVRNTSTWAYTSGYPCSGAFIFEFLKGSPPRLQVQKSVCVVSYRGDCTSGFNPWGNNTLTYSATGSNGTTLCDCGDATALTFEVNFASWPANA